MNEVNIIGLDLAKNVFQAYGAGVNGAGKARHVGARISSHIYALTFQHARRAC